MPFVEVQHLASVPRSHAFDCLDYHFFHECGHRITEKVNNKVQNQIVRKKHKNHLLSCRIRGCQIFNLNVVFPGKCKHDCQGITIPQDDLHFYNMLRAERERHEDATLKGEALRRVQEKREKKRRDEEQQRRQWPQETELKAGNVVVQHRY